MKSCMFCTAGQILLGDQIKMNDMEHVAGKGENRNVYRVLDGKPELKRPLGTSKLKVKSSQQAT